MKQLHQRAFLLAALAFGGLVCLTLPVLGTMLFWSDPGFEEAPDSSLDALAAADISLEQPYPATSRTFLMRDGALLHAQHLPLPGAQTTVVLLHGILSNSYPLNTTSGLLRETLDAEVIALDLRGHGASGGHPGDVDHKGQYEEDLLDIVRELRQDRPRQTIVLAGHSMGGGILIRLAGRGGLAPADQPDALLLMAPYLGWQAPTTRREANPSDAGFVAVHLPRLLALAALDKLGIRSFNGLRTLFFNMPDGTPLRSYSYRASQSFEPDDLEQRLAGIETPILLLVGSADRTFLPEAYGGAVSTCASCAVVLIPEASHNGVLRDAATFESIRDWRDALEI